MKKILLSGYQKCGNTWTRFIIFNYFNILKNDAKKTLTYGEIIRINEAIWNEVDNDWPNVYFTHVPKNGKTLLGHDRTGKVEFYDDMDGIITIVRNPFDCMISYFQYMTNRDKPFNGIFSGNVLKDLLTLEGFVKRYLPLYINHLQSVKPIADVVLDYDMLRKYPEGFGKAIELIFGNVDNRILSQAIDYSSFDNIKKMGIKTGRTGGMASHYRGHFTRNGKTGQYKEVMSNELINHIKIQCAKGGIKVD